MAFRDILLVLNTYPNPTPVSVIEHAVKFADAVGAKISAIACEVQVEVPSRFNFLSNLLIDVPGLAAAELQKSVDSAQVLLRAFETTAQKAGNYQETIPQRSTTADMPNVLVEYGRMRDLTIMPVHDDDQIDQWAAETVIFESGRPTLILPLDPARMRPGPLNTVVVAWDFSRPAARAIWDALPILEKAKTVRVITIPDEKRIDSSRSAEDLARYLARHGIEVMLEQVHAWGRTIGETVESYVTAHHADLLVMGAYGHSRVRQVILGGATKGLLSRPPLPIFFSH